MESIYNYIVTTDTRKEYLIGLKDYSSNSHTGEFLTNEISDIVEKLSSDKFAAIVTDAASNFNLACQKIQEMYPHIWNIRCAAHTVNLIASDLVKLDNLKKLIVNYLKIKGSGLKVWQPIKEVIYILETNEAILADYFAYLIELAIAIIHLPEINTFKILAMHIFNRRYEEFLHPLYILVYFIHPQYQKKDLNDNDFHKAALIAIEIWQSLGHTRSESNELVALIQRFEAKIPPFDLPYVSDKDTPKIWWGSFKKQSHLPELALRIFFINPTQANCERNFSILKWILGNRQTSLDINKLEGISKIKSYYTANIWRKLNFFSKELTEADLRNVCNMSSVGKIMDYNEDQTDANNGPSLKDMFNNSTILLIGKICDLETEKNLEFFAVNTVQADSLDNLDYDPSNSNLKDEEIAAEFDCDRTSSKFLQVERAFEIWISTVEQHKLTLTDEFASLLGISEEEFRASQGWLIRFKARIGLCNHKFYGEAESAPIELLPQFRKELKNILATYEPQDVFNADECGLYYRMESSFSLSTTVRKGKKKDKTRITVLFIANADGSEKLTPLIINKSKIPNAFRDANITYNQLPVDYYYNETAWMHQNIFKIFKVFLLCKFQIQERRVLLLIDGATSHTVNNLNEYPNIRVHFLPPNTTAHLQPMDAGIINAFKAYLLVQEYLNDDKFVIKEAIDNNRIIELINNSDINSNKADNLAKQNLNLLFKFTRQNVLQPDGFIKENDESFFRDFLSRTHRASIKIMKQNKEFSKGNHDEGGIANSICHYSIATIIKAEAQFIHDFEEAQPLGLGDNQILDYSNRGFNSTESQRAYDND
ncbi:33741_t:CDS:10 [Gigaspora margarita]|uniref:33741_t:CDS:1 n=1 Tax=Gigaspora margarita TaxID=4874 RepID=A0ABN7V0P2_GIGMA|nr:33741_t:CDS:10 [Gigaspora margarita]